MGNSVGIFVWTLFIASIFFNTAVEGASIRLPSSPVIAPIVLLPFVVMLVTQYLGIRNPPTQYLVASLWNLVWVVMVLFSQLVALEQRASEGGVPLWIGLFAETLTMVGIPMALLNLLFAFFLRPREHTPSQKNKRYD